MSSTSTPLSIVSGSAKTADGWSQEAVQDPPSAQKATLRTDGGYQAWASLVGGFFVATVTFGYVNAFGVYQDVYTREGTASASAISWIGSTQLFCVLAMGLPGGILLDKGYYRITLAIGSLLYVFSLFMVSIADRSKYYQLYLSQGLGMGIGAGLIYVPTMALQGQHWRARRALAMGVVVCGSSVGGIIFPIMLNQLFHGSTGFEWGVRASAFIVLALLLASNLLLYPRPVRAGRPSADIKAILSDVPYVMINIASLIIDWGLFFPYFYLQLYAVLHGVDPDVAFYTLAIMNAAAIPGRIVPNYLADRFGAFNTMIPVTFGCSALLFALFGIKDVAGTVVFAVLFGFFSGAFLSLCAPCVVILTTKESEIGARFGIAYLISSVGALTGNPIIGALLGDTFPWWKPILLAGIAATVGFVIFVVARNVIAARKRTPFV